MKNFYKASLATGLVMLLSATMVFAQTTISGKVTDAQGEAMPMASIKVKGTVTGTTADVEGNFSLTVISLR
jgi:hypothetical protein